MKNKLTVIHLQLQELIDEKIEQLIDGEVNHFIDEEIERSAKQHGLLKSERETFTFLFEHCENAKSNMEIIEKLIRSFWIRIKTETSQGYLPEGIERTAIDTAKSLIQIAATARKFDQQKKAGTV